MECLCCLARKAMLLAQAIERGIPAQRSTNRKRSSGSAAGCSQKKDTKIHRQMYHMYEPGPNKASAFAFAENMLLHLCKPCELSTHSLHQIVFAALSCLQTRAIMKPDSNSLVRSVPATLCHYGVSPTDAASTSLDGHGTRTHRPRHLFS